MDVLLVVASLILAAVFAGSGARKLAGSAVVAEEARHLRVPLAAYRAIGAAEVAGAAGLVVGLFWMPLGVVTAGALAILMLGAVAAHVRVGDRAPRWLPAAVLAGVAAGATVVGAVA